MRWLLILMASAMPLITLAANDDSHHRCSPEGIALGGYDLISYRQSGGPIAGSDKYRANHGGLSYLFASAKNLSMFTAAPADYLPRYSGWCATSLAMGQLVCPDYTNFKLEDGELLLFELAGFTNGRTLWNTDPAGFRLRADTNASKLLSNQ